MEENMNDSIMSPNYVPDELKTPYDIVELPSQGLLYKNKKNKVKVEYLTAMDESVLTSPNLSKDPNLMINVLLKRKVKDLGFDPEELLEGDRIALLLFLRATGIGEKYYQIVYDPNNNDFVEGEIDLTTLKQKKLLIKPDENNEFDFVLPLKKYKVKFRLLTSKDEEEISKQDELLQKRDPDKVSTINILRLERSIMEIDGVRDKMKISNIIKNLPLLDSRSIREYIKENEPGIIMETSARIQGGGSVDCFLRIGTNFFFPKL
jgi:hypothetical protein